MSRDFGSPRRNSRARAGFEAAFWALLSLAVVIGAPSAVYGLPVLADLVTPAAVFEAQASVAPRIPAPALRGSFAAVSTAPILRPLSDENELSSVPDAELRASQEDAEAVAPVLTVPEAPRQPVIALVIDDLGNDVAETRRAIALPKGVSLSFLPYPSETPRLVREARDVGHQILVHVPMEAVQDRDGSLKSGLWRGLPVQENLRRLAWALSRVEGYAGINNHEGSVFTADRAALVPVAEALYGQGIFFLDSRTSPSSQVVPVARGFGVPSADRDVFLDDDQDSHAVAQQLRELERIARVEGVAIGIGHPHKATLDLVTRWCAGLKGIQLIPASEAIRLKTELDMGVKKGRIASSQ
ncbi:hypothetical protein FHS83_003019 [Rhizomicrobium palustre]|uniref:Divergent polysaccharide deacetylase family protein n=1 Tax=Rhizomicrobium palustre TaxID=189966 RepID=A0A846N344_9PROT|nr:hypothetical protein [Rhizomicrobium palustre]